MTTVSYCIGLKSLKIEANLAGFRVQNAIWPLGIVHIEASQSLPLLSRYPLQLGRHLFGSDVKVKVSFYALH